MFWLYITTLIVSGLSIVGIRLNHLGLVKPGNPLQVLILPGSFPSIWNIIQPTHLSNWFVPVVLLLLQAWLSGGFFGSLVRLNTWQTVTGASFVMDATRSFLRLLLWSLLWDSIALALAGFTHALPMFGTTAAFVLLAVHYVFFFVPIGLVAEQASSMREAVGTSVRALLDGFLPMLPYAGLMMLLTAIGLTLSAAVPWSEFIFLSILYLGLMTWLWHMVMARYLVFSDWVAPATTPSTAPSRSPKT